MQTFRKELPDETPELAEAVPPKLLNALRAYAIHHSEVGHFLTAVLSNDLVEAFGRADIGSRLALNDIVTYVVNAFPSDCWGSKEKVAAWLAQKPIEPPY
jgi:hypothetical protein